VTNNAKEKPVNIDKTLDSTNSDRKREWDQFHWKF